MIMGVFCVHSNQDCTDFFNCLSSVWIEGSKSCSSTWDFLNCFIA